MQIPTPMRHLSRKPLKSGMFEEGLRQVKNMCPKYAQEFIWGTVQDDISPATRYSLSADPLPSPPQSELDNSIVRDTICNHPDLFKIMCNINISRFKRLLWDHPNQPFIQSVILGLTEGFWPWAEKPQDYPTTHYKKTAPS